MRSPLSIITLLALCLFLVSGCTQNQIVKQFGGDITVNLPPGRKLVVVTWKNNDMWHLTRPMREGEMPETSVFQEDSSFGIVEGSVTFVESPLAQ